MSDQPEHDGAMPDQADAADDAVAPAPTVETPRIRTRAQPAAGGRGRNAPRPSRRKTTSAFDAAALRQLVDLPSADSSSAADRVAPPDAPPDQTAMPFAERESQAGEATESPDETVDAARILAAENLPPAPDLQMVPVGIRPGSTTLRRTGLSRHAQRRKSRSQAFGWILFGLCGVPALLAAVLLVKRLPWPPPGAVVPRDESRTFATEDAIPLPPSPDVKPADSSRAEERPKENRAEASARNGRRPKRVQPDDFSRTGVRPMNAEELARRRQGIDSFAEMGRTETEKLHREKPPPDASADLEPP